MSGNLEARLERLESELQDLRDREAIREVIHRYCQAADRCDLEMLKGCYHPDGYDDHGFFAGNTHAFSDYVIPCLEQIDSSVHAITNTRIQLDGDRASCASQWSVVHRLRHDEGFTDFWHQGRYLDVFEKRDGEWKILHRVVAGDMDRWIETLDIRTQALGDENATLSGCRGTEDPGYLGFDLLKHKPDRPAMDDLWTGFHALSAATRGTVGI
jgi:ketosteroid isomerase-like protein